MALLSHLGFDIGASGGRALLGTVEDAKLVLAEVHRFANAMETIDSRLCWNTDRLFREITTGIAAAAASVRGRHLESIGIDAWGVDFALLGTNGTLLAQPIAYRDTFTDGIMNEVFTICPRAEIYTSTGIQFLPFNTLYQLFALKKYQPSLLERARALVFIPDYLNVLLSGQITTEYTIASTSQLLNASKRDWDWKLIDAVNLPATVFQEIVDPASSIGQLRGSIAAETGINTSVRILSVASHDTASAVVAVPSLSQNFAYISSGTWSLMGIETRQPIITSETLRGNFTNEGGVEDTFRVLKNIAGMWLLEECRRDWANTHESYDGLLAASMQAEPFARIIDPDAAVFLHPESMPEAIQQMLANSSQPAAQTHGDVVRCIFESLALKYRFVLEELRRISPHPIDVIHIIGGGSRNSLLCQWTANACGLPVIAGPAEATAIGNIMMQARASGAFDSLGTIRRTILNSITTHTYTPRDVSQWNDVFDRHRAQLTFQAD
jgi:rhamnulokinase